MVGTTRETLAHTLGDTGVEACSTRPTTRS
jgi:hypothetical protein